MAKKTEPKAPKAPKVEKPVEPEAISDGTRKVTIIGRPGNTLQVSINGIGAELPCGKEITVSEDLYNAISAHIVEER